MPIRNCTITSTNASEGSRTLGGKCRRCAGWSALQFADREAIDGIESSDFPVPETQYNDFLLTSSGLTEQAPAKSAVISYNSEYPKSIAEFSYKFAQKSRLIGLPKAVLYISASSHDDMNIFVILRKRDKDGKLLMHLCFPFSAISLQYKSIDDISEKERVSLNLHLGSVDVLRASHRAFDPARSIPEQFPLQPHDKEEKVTPDDVVKLEIGIWSMGVDFDEGESISVQVSDSFPTIAEYKAFSTPRSENEKNKGEHRDHAGLDTPRRVILPFVPL